MTRITKENKSNNKKNDNNNDSESTTLAQLPMFLYGVPPVCGGFCLSLCTKLFPKRPQAEFCMSHGRAVFPWVLFKGTPRTKPLLQ